MAHRGQVVSLGSGVGKRGWRDPCDSGRIEPSKNRVITSKGEIPYDYLIICDRAEAQFRRGAELAPSGYTQSVCNVDHAEQAWGTYQAFSKTRSYRCGSGAGGILLRPHMKWRFILDADLRKKKPGKKFPIYFVTPEPYIGHMGLAGSTSRRLMEDEFAEHAMKPICNTSIKEVQPGKMVLEGGQEIPFRYSMIIPPFAGVDAVAGTPGLCNPKGFLNIDAYQAIPSI